VQAIVAKEKRANVLNRGFHPSLANRPRGWTLTAVGTGLTARKKSAWVRLSINCF